MTYTKLDSRFKKLWVAALRSGNYKQGHGHLKLSINEYCCLGVACDILTNHDIGYWSGNTFHLNTDTSSRSLTLSNSIREIINLDHKAEIRLWKLNDTGRSFKYIANWIETHL